MIHRYETGYRFGFNSKLVPGIEHDLYREQHRNLIRVAIWGLAWLKKTTTRYPGQYGK